MHALESVPNVSEGRHPAVVEAIADAFSSAGATVLDTHVDADHHRSVVTLIGDERAGWIYEVRVRGEDGRLHDVAYLAANLSVVSVDGEPVE